MRLAILGDGMLAQAVGDILAPECCMYACYEDEGCACPGCDGKVQFTTLGHDTFDIRSLDSLVKALTPIKPDVIVNTVALHALQRCEDDPNLAFEVNARGAGRVASLAPTIFISTDYLFNDGGPHAEVLPGRTPRSQYGRSKLMGELETLEHSGLVVRVSGLYHHAYESHKGPSFPTQILSDHSAIRVASDQTFSPTYAPDAAERIVDLALALAGEGTADTLWPTGIYHAANDGSTTWAEFAQHIVELTGHDRHILPSAKHDPLRPQNSALVSTKLPPLRHWKQGLGAWEAAR